MGKKGMFAMYSLEQNMRAWLIASAMFRAYTNKQLGKSGKS